MDRIANFFTSYKFLFWGAISEAFLVLLLPDIFWSVLLHLAAMCYWIITILNRFNSQFNYSETERKREIRINFHEFGRLLSMLNYKQNKP